MDDQIERRIGGARRVNGQQSGRIMEEEECELVRYTVNV